MFCRNCGKQIEDVAVACQYCGTATGNTAAPGPQGPQQTAYPQKSRMVAGLLQLFLGGLGIGRFYTGHYGIAVAQLLTAGGCGVWALIDGIMFLTGSVTTDADGIPLKD
jgi:Predicted membrane protein